MVRPRQSPRDLKIPLQIAILSRSQVQNSVRLLKPGWFFRYILEGYLFHKLELSLIIRIGGPWSCVCTCAAKAHKRSERFQVRRTSNANVWCFDVLFPDDKVYDSLWNMHSLSNFKLAENVSSSRSAKELFAVCHGSAECFSLWRRPTNFSDPKPVAKRSSGAVRSWSKGFRETKRAEQSAARLPKHSKKISKITL